MSSSATPASSVARGSSRSALTQHIGRDAPATGSKQRARTPSFNSAFAPRIGTSRPGRQPHKTWRLVTFGRIVVQLWHGPPSIYRPRADPTLAQLRNSSCWTCVCCEAFGCHHSAPWAFAPLIIRWGEQASCVDGPRLARDSFARRTEVACSHVSGLLTQPGWTAGPDGVRELSPHHSNGIDAPMKRQVCLSCVGSTDCAITRHCSLASSST